MVVPKVFILIGNHLVCAVYGGVNRATAIDVGDTH